MRVGGERALRDSLGLGTARTTRRPRRQPGCGQTSCSHLPEYNLGVKGKRERCRGCALVQAPRAGLNWEKAGSPPPASQVFVGGNHTACGCCPLPPQPGIVVPVQYLPTTHSVHGCGWIWGKAVAACPAINLGVGSSHTQMLGTESDCRVGSKSEVMSVEYFLPVIGTILKSKPPKSEF